MEVSRWWQASQLVVPAGDGWWWQQMGATSQWRKPCNWLTRLRDLDPQFKGDRRSLLVTNHEFVHGFEQPLIPRLWKGCMGWLRSPVRKSQTDLCVEGHTSIQASGTRQQKVRIVRVCCIPLRDCYIPPLKLYRLHGLTAMEPC